MAEGDLAKVRGLTILAERIPPNIKDELITELAKDDQLNPKSVPVEGIRERLTTIDHQQVLDAVGTTRLSLLLQLASSTDMATARGLWQERPELRNALGRAATELRTAAKQILATLAGLGGGSEEA
ncbi:hypothetical protein HOG48_02960 [Candidatus Peregrinibacteria bacterium]|jgi:hypothetical protein|nr:hypothetical protein [Candidatus Peregrinibacteria bacterium]